MYDLRQAERGDGDEPDKADRTKPGRDLGGSSRLGHEQADKQEQRGADLDPGRYGVGQTGNGLEPLDR